ncbi:hypothetical protein [Xanthomonas euvesicatoria]|uniref:hypothetical protein n=1 Tax=Xanthomonas euvesicatoria TaxID=456327 RepID=UPI001C4815BA|nr:hypothetical protein [Xanthomonas euvesicatoria]MBV6671487.1 hypothetical protein [Xanthomonas euvesicatoria pv. alangii]MBV6840158.1 hypothetical protein [Xanthomonas campestris pv. fici]
MLYLLLGLIATEGLLLITWNRLYFSWGLPVFTRRIAVTRDALACFSLAQVENAVEPSRWPDLRFHRLSEDVYAFRETFLFVGGVYPMIMRGRIVIDRRRREIIVSGFCNWTVVMMVVGFLVPAAVVRPGATLMFAGLLMLSYLLQRSRFISVEAAVRMLLHTNTTPLIPRRPEATPRVPAD